HTRFSRDWSSDVCSSDLFGQQSLVMFSRELKEAVIPFVESEFRVATGAANRALAGLSMGGLHTLHTGARSTDLFSFLGVFSSGRSEERRVGDVGIASWLR